MLHLCPCVVIISWEHQGNRMVKHDCPSTREAIQIQGELAATNSHKAQLFAKVCLTSYVY